MNAQSLPPAGLIRRLAAFVYDSFIIAAVVMMAAGVVVALLQALVASGVISYAPYTDVGDFLTSHPFWGPIYTAYLAIVWIGFLTFFWVRAGQTLGMRAWKLELQNEQGGRISTTQALIRIATSAFGLANLLVPLDPQKRGFHDIWAKTQVVVLPKAR
ncbi:RDD family protein [Vibrio hippocampi]|nr:RDD family protein [Vibrio hippocampi]